MQCLLEIALSDGCLPNRSTPDLASFTNEQITRSQAEPVHVGRSLDDSEVRAAEGVGAGRSSVHGTVTVSLARYLEVEVDLLYNRPASSEAAAPGSAPTRFRLVSERRMRSGELHYVDHPLFGVLVLLTPG